MAALAWCTDQGCGAVTTTPAIPVRTLSDVLRDIMIEIALRQKDPADRDAMLVILEKDGWL